MPVTNYYTIDGQMIGYKTAAGRKDFLTDALGSVTAEVDQTGATKTFDGRYQPYGGDLSSTGTRGSYGWVGTWGYRETGLSSSSHYVRARHFSKTIGRWNTVDPLWPIESAYGYAGGRIINSVDPSGLQVKDWGEFDGRRNCNTCTVSIKQWFDTKAHHCNHAYTHCMACCVLTEVASPDCARGAQYLQNLGDYWTRKIYGGIYVLPGFPTKGLWENRDIACASGIGVAQRPVHKSLEGRTLPRGQSNCSAGCSKLYPDPPIDTPECAAWRKAHPKDNGKLPYLPECDPFLYDTRACRRP